MYTLIAKAKLNGVDPQAWLADVLRRIADHPASRLYELLPWHWKQQPPPPPRDSHLSRPSPDAYGLIETSAALGACLLILTVAAALDRRPIGPASETRSDHDHRGRGEEVPGRRNARLTRSRCFRSGFTCA